MPIKKDITGQQFGKLTAVKPTDKRIQGSIVWELNCDCGAVVFRNVKTLIRSSNQNATSSCGCQHSVYTSTHGYCTNHKKRKAYSTWSSMNNRCSKTSRGNKYYGMRGIIVCERWRDSFENFLADMGERPSLNHSIDRIDVNGNYEPSNCRWATRSIQVRNRRRLRDTKSKNIGVTWMEQIKKWASRITINEKRIYLGVFSSLEDAIAARKAAEIKYFTESP